MRCSSSRSSWSRAPHVCGRLAPDILRHDRPCGLVVPLQPLQIGAQIRRALTSHVAVFLECLRDEAMKVWRQIGIQLQRAGGRFAENLVRHDRWCHASERQDAGCHLVERRRTRTDRSVRRRVRLAPAPETCTRLFPASSRDSSGAPLPASSAAPTHPRPSRARAWPARSRAASRARAR